MAWSVNDFRSSNFISSYASNDAKLPIHFKMVVNWVYTQCMTLLEEQRLPLDLGLGKIRWWFYLITPQSCLDHPKVWIARWPNSLVVKRFICTWQQHVPWDSFYILPLMPKLVTVPHIACGLIAGWLFPLVLMKDDYIQFRWLFYSSAPTVHFSLQGRPKPSINSSQSSLMLGQTSTRNSPFLWTRTTG